MLHLGAAPLIAPTQCAASRLLTPPDSMVPIDAPERPIILRFKEGDKSNA